MKRYLFLILFTGLTSFAEAQNVGIGTTTPAAKLDVIGTIKITDGSEGANKILTSGSTGLATWTAAPAQASFLFATDQSLGNGDYLGLGASSAGFLRNTIVVPVNCELTSIFFSIRQNAVGFGITATVYRQPLNGVPVATTLSAVITDATVTYNASATGSVLLSAGDLISIRFISGGGGLSNGAAVSLTYR